ncbi:peptidoglycan-binding protein [Sporolactobacillus sp. THM7-4]|nr:peptidoglycan-binding protein [Sporolactobacillus sp. THM7-4]
MNIIKRLTAVTSLMVLMGILTPTTIVLARTSSTNDSHIIKKDHPGTESHAVGFASNSLLTHHTDNINTLFGSRLLHQGDSGPFVATLQDELRVLGYYDGQVNGSFDKRTTDAVQSFQSRQHIGENSIAGPGTKTALYNLYRHSDEAKAYLKKAKVIREQEKEAKKAKAQKAAKAKAEQAARKKVKTAREERKSKTSSGKTGHRTPAVEELAYHPEQKKQDSSPRPSGQSSLTVVATGYTLKGITATGMDLGKNSGARVIAVDPRLIPLGSKVLIPGYGVYTAADTGGKIKGKRIDIHFETNQEAINFGRRSMKITIID